jgi:hypothetical protein
MRPSTTRSRVGGQHRSSWSGCGPRTAFGHAKQGAIFGHTKIAGKQVLRRGLSPMATTISTDTAGPRGRHQLIAASPPAWTEWPACLGRHPLTAGDGRA